MRTGDLGNGRIWLLVNDTLQHFKKNKADEVHLRALRDREIQGIDYGIAAARKLRLSALSSEGVYLQYNRDELVILGVLSARYEVDL